jgi:ribosomal protein L25 (general stress protein Ctc)
MDLQIRVDPRTVTGKHTKRLVPRRSCPAWSSQAGSVAVQLDAKALTSCTVRPDASIVRVSVDGGDTTSVVIKSIQRHPLTGRACTSISSRRT